MTRKKSKLCNHSHFKWWNYSAWLLIVGLSYSVTFPWGSVTNKCQIFSECHEHIDLFIALIATKQLHQFSV